MPRKRIIKNPRRAAIAKKRKKKNAERSAKLKDMRERVIKYRNFIGLPVEKNKILINGKLVNTIDSNSFFNIHETRYKGQIMEGIIKTEKPSIVKKSVRIPLNLTLNQQNIILQWMKAAECMYNETLNHIKTNRFVGIKSTINARKLRSIMKNEKDILAKKYNTPVHILDSAIKRLVQGLKSAFSNLKNGNIRHFNIRYLKHNKPIKVITIEKDSFKGNTFYKTYMGENIDSVNVDFKTHITSDCTLQYNKKGNRFVLYTTKNCDVKIYDTADTISIDPGIRTFLSCVSDFSVYEIGKDNQIPEKIKYHLETMDNIKKKPIPQKIKKRYEISHNKKIHGLVTELHWKSIDFLVKRFKTICIGKWSTKSILSNQRSVLCPMTKRIASRLRFYEFLTKLKYKCDAFGVNLMIVDESFTSKVCSHCSWEHKKLGGEKVFKCGNCTMVIDRDLNGARNIYMRALNQ